jgi:hypothetical protein
MASASHTLTADNESTIDVDLVGQTPDGALYRLVTRSLAKPFAMEFQYKIGAPSAKGNDKVIVKISDTIQNATTGLFSVGSVKLELSIPRDTTWTETLSKDMLSYMAKFCIDATNALLVDAITP